MFPTLLASFWSNLSVFHEKMRITKKSKKYFFFRKKMYLFFFWIFCFLTFSRIFQEVKKSENFCVFFLQVKFTWCLWTKILTWKLSHLWWKFFWSFLQTIATTQNFFYVFEIHVHILDQFEKKKTENLKKNSKNVQLLKFHLWLCGRNFGRSAENSIKNILLPKILTKNILSKIRPLHHQNIQKVDPLPQKKMAIFLGGVALYLWLIPVRF